MIPLRSALLLAALLALKPLCPASPQVTATTGDLKVEPLYNGQTLDTLGAGFSLAVWVDGTFRAGLAGNNQGVQSSYTLTISSGVHTVEIRGSAGVLATTPVNVITGAVTTVNPELNAALGMIRGTVQETGAPPPAATYLICNYLGGSSVTACGPWIPATGIFFSLMEAGTRLGAVTKKNTGPVLSFSYTAIAGVEVDLGILNVPSTAPTTLRVQPFYGGVLLDPAVGYQFRMLVDGTPFRDFSSGVNSINVPTIPGVHTLAFRDPFGNVNLVTVAVNAAAGVVTTVNPELNTGFATFHGVLQVNGAVPPTGAYYSCSNNTGQGCAPVSTAGAFRNLVTAGPGLGGLYKNGAGLVVPLSFNIPAGTDYDFGTINFEYGDLTIQPTYNAQTLDQLGAGYSLDVYVDNVFRTRLSTGQPSYTLPVTPGAHTVRVTQANASGLGVMVNANVPLASATTANPELSTALGLMRGVILINGGPPPANSYFVCGYSDRIACGPNLGSSGQFRNMIAPGARTGALFRTTTGLVLTFNYTAIAGVEVDVGTPGSLQLQASVTTRSGTAASRFWTMPLQNTGAATATSTQVTSFALTQTMGTPCSPVLLSTLPVSYGDIASGATVTRQFNINFTGCSGTSRFTLSAVLSGLGQTQTVTMNNLLP